MPGPRGPQGLTGSRGGQGPRGYNGSNGTPGAPGARGAPGIQGPVGHPGLPGVNGTRGERGAKGSQGPVGRNLSSCTYYNKTSGGANKGTENSVHVDEGTVSIYVFVFVINVASRPLTFTQARRGGLLKVPNTHLRRE